MPPPTKGWVKVTGGAEDAGTFHSLYFPSNGRYVSAELGYTDTSYAMLRAQATKPDGIWNLFLLRWDSRTSTYALRSLANNRYVATETGFAGEKYGILRARSGMLGPGEQFVLVPERKKTSSTGG